MNPDQIADKTYEPLDEQEMQMLATWAAEELRGIVHTEVWNNAMTKLEIRLEKISDQEQHLRKQFKILEKENKDGREKTGARN